MARDFFTLLLSSIFHNFSTVPAELKPSTHRAIQKHVLFFSVFSGWYCRLRRGLCLSHFGRYVFGGLSKGRFLCDIVFRLFCSVKSYPLLRVGLEPLFQKQKIEDFWELPTNPQDF